METKYYEFDQNNSGGYFQVDDELCQRIYIEAKNYKEAEEIALEKGVYFNGVSEGMDCSCCGDRWYEGEEIGDLKELSESFGEEFKAVQDYVQHLVNRYGFTSKGVLGARIFNLDGTKIEILKTE